MEEIPHLIKVINLVRESLLIRNSEKLNELSNQTIHQASTHQDEGCITLAVIVYTLSKLIERKDNEKTRNWDKFVKKFNSWLDLAILALKNREEEKYHKYLTMARKAITSVSPNLKPYIQEVLRKASINKASRIYEHGISMGKTAKMLGITQWELSEYAGQKNIPDNPFNESIDVKKRAVMAMEFFS